MITLWKDLDAQERQLKLNLVQVQAMSIFVEHRNWQNVNKLHQYH